MKIKYRLAMKVKRTFINVNKIVRMIITNHCNNDTLHTSTQEKFHLELKLGKIIMLTLESLTMVYLELNQAFMDLENAKKDLNDAFEQNSKEKKVLEEKIKNYFETIQDLRSQVITLELENKESRELSVPLAQNLKSMIEKFEQNSPLRKEILKEVSDGIDRKLFQNYFGISQSTFYRLDKVDSNKTLYKILD
jgi:chromosome segregation ATPase